MIYTYPRLASSLSPPIALSPLHSRKCPLPRRSPPVSLFPRAHALKELAPTSPGRPPLVEDAPTKAAAASADLLSDGRHIEPLDSFTKEAAAPASSTRRTVAPNARLGTPRRRTGPRTMPSAEWRSRTREIRTQDTSRPSRAGFGMSAISSRPSWKTGRSGARTSTSTTSARWYRISLRTSEGPPPTLLSLRSFPPRSDPPLAQLNVAVPLPSTPLVPHVALKTALETASSHHPVAIALLAATSSAADANLRRVGTLEADKIRLLLPDADENTPSRLPPNQGEDTLLQVVLRPHVATTLPASHPLLGPQYRITRTPLWPDRLVLRLTEKSRIRPNRQTPQHQRTSPKRARSSPKLPRPRMSMRWT